MEKLGMAVIRQVRLLGLSGEVGFGFVTVPFLVPPTVKVRLEPQRGEWGQGVCTTVWQGAVC